MSEKTKVIVVGLGNQGSVVAQTILSKNMPIVVVDNESPRGLTITKENILPAENIFTINGRISDTEFYDNPIIGGTIGGSIGGFTKSDLKGFNKRIKKRRKKNKNKKTHRRK